MKYLTSSLLAMEGDSAAEVIAGYEAYFASIREQLPRDLVELKSAHTLHDARLERVICDFGRGQVEICLRGWDVTFNRRIRYRLHFSGVVSLEQRLPLARGADPELGDLAYWECSMSPDGLEMGLLFINAGEVHVAFSGFRLSHQQIAM